MQKLIAVSIVCLLILGSSGCSDWRLRGSQADHAVTSKVFLGVDNTSGERSAVYRHLSALLRHQKKRELKERADIQLILGEPVFNRRTISVNNQLRTAEFQLTLTIPYKILSRQGALLHTNTELLTRSYRFNERDIVGKNKEEELLKKEMARDIADQILHQLHFYHYSMGPT